MRYEDYLLTDEWKEKAQKRIEIDEMERIYKARRREKSA